MVLELETYLAGKHVIHPRAGIDQSVVTSYGVTNPKSIGMLKFCSEVGLTLPLYGGAPVGRAWMGWEFLRVS